MNYTNKTRKNASHQNILNNDIKNTMHNTQRERVNGEGVQENILNVQDIEDS